MYRKCNLYIKELYNNINSLFSKINKSYNLSLSLKTHTCKNIKPITAESTIGEQIKYFRSRNDIKQTDLGLKLGYGRDALNHLENKEIKQIDINLLKKIIKELNIENELIINDSYIKFLMDNPCEKIRNARKKNKMSQLQFGNLLGVSYTSVRRWEHGNNNISRSKYEKLKNFI